MKYVYLGFVANFRCSDRVGMLPAGQVLWNYVAPLYIRCTNIVSQKSSAWHVLPTQVDLVLDKENLEGIDIYKWVPTYGIHKIYSDFDCKILHPVPPPGHRWPAQSGQAPEFGYTGP